MNENINLVEILKDCPEGTKLYSPICGEVKLVSISEEGFPIKVITVKGNDECFYITFLPNGQYIDCPDGECLLFPSRDNHDWNTFATPELKGESEDERIRKSLNEAALQYVDTCTVDGEVTHGNITEPYWNNHSMMNAYKAGWLEKQSEIDKDSQVKLPTFTCEDTLALECSMNLAKITEGGDELYKILVPLYNKIYNAYLLQLQGEQKLLNNDKYQTVSVEILDRLYESEKELERLKRGEQKPTDKVEPKFNAGVWIVNNVSKDVFLINGYYTLVDTEGNISSPCLPPDESEFHLWTIKDAKDGDVLATKSGDKIFLYNGKCDLRHRPCAYCGIYKGFNEFIFSKCAIGNCFAYEDVYPTTKEQQELLFQKMKESGYEWDDGKKELKEITMKYIDLGLPSNTLWAECNEEGFYTFDEAVSKYGDNLPTKEQWEEVIKECRWKWNGSGYNVTGPNGNSITLPAEGHRSCNGGVYRVGSGGLYWSSSLYNSDYAWNLFLYSGDVGVYYRSRYGGESVRLVK